jgi:hypothetical protein
VKAGGIAGIHGANPNRFYLHQNTSGKGIIIASSFLMIGKFIQQRIVDFN